MMTPALEDTLVQAAQDNLYTFSLIAPSDFLYSYIALAVGVLIIVISYIFGGARNQKVKILISALTGITVAVLTLPLLIYAANHIFQTSPVLIFCMLVLAMIFAVIVACHLYELFVIRTGEVFKDD